jgi:hypothetical protein
LRRLIDQMGHDGREGRPGEGNLNRFRLARVLQVCEAPGRGGLEPAEGGRAMFQTGGYEKGTSNATAKADNGGARERRQRFDVVDLFEELLARRAELGFRPVLYVSSERDLECNLIGMFEAEIAAAATGEAVPPQTSLEALRRKLQ